MITDKDFADKVHMLIHSVRLLPNYAPTNFEKRISELVIEKFKDSCEECKKIGEAKKNVVPNKGIIKTIGDALKGEGS